MPKSRFCKGFGVCASQDAEWYITFSVYLGFSPGFFGVSVNFERLAALYFYWFKIDFWVKIDVLGSKLNVLDQKAYTNVVVWGFGLYKLNNWVFLGSKLNVLGAKSLYKRRSLELRSKSLWKRRSLEFKVLGAKLNVFGIKIEYWELNVNLLIFNRYFWTNLLPKVVIICAIKLNVFNHYFWTNLLPKVDIICSLKLNVFNRYFGANLLPKVDIIYSLKLNVFNQYFGANFVRKSCHYLIYKIECF